MKELKYDNWKILEATKGTREGGYTEFIQVIGREKTAPYQIHVIIELKNTPENMKIAKLIASAPEILESLIEAVDQAEIDQDESYDHWILDEYVDKWKAVIEKAK